MTSRYACSLTRHRVAILMLCAGVGAISAAAVPRLHTDNSVRAWFEPQAAAIERYDLLIELFGSDEYVVVAFPVDDAFSDETLATIERLGDALAGVPNVERVTSLTSIESVRARPDGSVAVGDLITAVPPSDAERAEAAERTARDPLLRKRVVSLDGRVAGIIARTAAELDEHTRHAVAEEVTRAARAVLGSAPALAGAPILDAAFFALSNRDMARLLPVMLGVIGGLFGLFFRSAAAVLLPMAVVALSSGVSLGAMAATGTTLNVLGSLIPLVLLVVGVASSVHVLSAYHAALRAGIDRTAAIETAIDEVLRPCVVANVTTAIGFGAFALSSSPPIRSFGLFTALGILASCALSVTGLPAALGLLRAPRPSGVVGARLRPLWAWTARAPLAHTRGLLLGAVAAAVASAVGLSRLTIDENWIRYFPPDHSVPSSIELIESSLFGSGTLETVFRGDPERLLSPPLLERIDAYARFLRERPLVDRTTSLPDFLKQMNRELHDGREDAYRLPTDPDLVHQYVLLLQKPDGDIHQYMDFDGSALRVSASVYFASAREVRSVVRQAGAYLDEHFEDERAFVTGLTDLNFENGQNIVAIQIDSLSLAVPLIIGAIGLLLRSVRLIPLIAVATVLPVLLCLGLMGLLGIPLNSGTALVGSISLGLVVDDAVYLVSRLRRESAAGTDLETALARSLERVGPALLCTTLIAGLGFGLLGLADFQPNARLGLLTAFSLSVALVIDVVLLPALASLAPWLLATRVARAVAPEAR